MKRLIIVLLAVALSGCGWFSKKDKPDAPAELVDFKPTLEVKKVWSVNIGKGNSKQGINLTPFYTAGAIYAADHKGNVVAVDTEDGDVLWRSKTEVEVSAGPAVYDALLLLGSLEGQVHAFDSGSGSPLWTAPVSSETLSLPVVHDGVVVVRCIDGRVFGLDARDGSRRWIYDRSVPLLSLRGSGTPLVRAGIAYLGYDDGQVIALRVSDGTFLWESNVAEPEGRTELERLADIDGDMALVATDLYVSSYKGRLASLAVESGRRLWFKDVGSVTGVVVERTRMALSDVEGNVWLLDRRTGATTWKQEMLLRRGLTRPAIYGSQLVVGDAEGYLHWFDLEQGELVARNKIDSDGLASAPIAIGTTLYVLANNGDLVALRAGAAI